ncbi:alpha/beta hydrolase [Streptomyces winkii]|uniref:alpha/beta hydrolase n=1 Tax=Streptomyces winkii TaxID=3051178 RepID=UPI0028D5B0B6|nr:alpha/beta fold hydrolase [Streptomyces sp. DSM 40971]
MTATTRITMHPVRNDALPRIAGGLLSAVVATGLTVQQLRHRRVLRGQGDESFFETSTGNVLAYQLTEAEGPDSSPVLVCETGLASTVEHWTWLRRMLGCDHPVLAYNRAGYGRSEYRLGEPFSLAAAVADLRDLVRGVCASRPVVLVGHSLGGHLALRAIEPLRDLVTGVVLLDPSHPAELLRSRVQADGANVLTSALALMPESARLGLGSLLAAPPWLRWLPEDMRPLILDQFRDWKLWKATVREWRATHAEFLNHDGVLPKVGVPLRLVAAATTHARDPIHAELHRELVGTSPDGDLCLIEDARHDELVMNEQPAAQVAELIREFTIGLRTGGLRTSGHRPTPDAPEVR